MKGTQDLSPAQLDAIAAYRRDIDEACDPDRWVQVKATGPNGPRDGDRLVVGTVVRIDIHQLEGGDRKRVVFHRLYGGSETAVFDRDGSHTASFQFVNEQGDFTTQLDRPRVFADKDLVSFEGEFTSHDRFNTLGVAWEGGRKEFGGPVFESPFPFTYRNAHVIDGTSTTGDQVREAKANSIKVGEVIGIIGLPGYWKVVGPSWSNGGIKFEPVNEV